MTNGTGGQPDSHYAAFYSKGGRAITVMRSTAFDGAVSRIVATHEPGTAVTIPRFLADTIVTEHGVARLFGKSVRERAAELIAIAHPDSSSVASTSTNEAAPPLRPIAAAASRPDCASRSAIITRAPSSAQACAEARPRPDAPPRGESRNARL